MQHGPVRLDRVVFHGHARQVLRDRAAQQLPTGARRRESTKTLCSTLFRYPRNSPWRSEVRHLRQTLAKATRADRSPRSRPVLAKLGRALLNRQRKTSGPDGLDHAITR
ncbi:hypothetical protein GCM10009634_11920 [Saccharothrix xinjiangensis]